MKWPTPKGCGFESCPDHGGPRAVMAARKREAAEAHRAELIAAGVCPSCEMDVTASTRRDARNEFVAHGGICAACWRETPDPSDHGGHI